jgi:hypothetical protein
VAFQISAVGMSQSSVTLQATGVTLLPRGLFGPLMRVLLARRDQQVSFGWFHINWSNVSRLQEELENEFGTEDVGEAAADENAEPGEKRKKLYGKSKKVAENEGRLDEKYVSAASVGTEGEIIWLSPWGLTVDDLKRMNKLRAMISTSLAGKSVQGPPWRGRHPGNRNHKDAARISETAAAKNGLDKSRKNTVVGAGKLGDGHAPELMDSFEEAHGAMGGGEDPEQDESNLRCTPLQRQEIVDWLRGIMEREPQPASFTFSDTDLDWVQVPFVQEQSSKVTYMYTYIHAYIHIHMHTYLSSLLRT